MERNTNSIVYKPTQDDVNQYEIVQSASNHVPSIVWEDEPSKHSTGTTQKRIGQR